MGVQHHQRPRIPRDQAPRRQSRGCLLVVIGFLALCCNLLSITALAHPAPTLPPYSHTIGAVSYPSKWEMILFSEGFGSFRTSDSHATVLSNYKAILATYGWEGWWYRDRNGYCYTILIIENNPFMAKTPPGQTSIALKLRAAFESEIGAPGPLGAPADCK